MKLPIILVAAICPLLIEADILKRPLKKETFEMEMIQAKVNNLMMGLVEAPSDWILDQHQDLFQKSNVNSVVTNFQSHYKKGLLPKDRVFNIRDPDIREETIIIFELLFYTSDFESLYQVASWLHGVMNYEQYTYALAVALVHRQDIVVKLPPWTQVLPNYFVPIKYIEEWRSEELDVESGNMLLLWGNTTDGLGFLMDDPVLAVMYYNWQIEFPSWLEPAKYGLPEWKGRTELYYRFYSQLLMTFLLSSETLENWSNMDSNNIWNWLNITSEFGDGLVNSVGQPIVHVPIPVTYVDSKMEEIEKKFFNTKGSEWFFQTEGSETIDLNLSNGSISFTRLVATVFNLTESFNSRYYGSYLDTLIDIAASYGSNPKEDGGNLAGYPLTAVKDPQFYGILANATIIPYTFQPTGISAPIHGIHFSSFKVSDVKTMYVPYDMDVSHYVNKMAPKGTFTVQLALLERTPLVATMEIVNSGSDTRKILVRLLYRSPKNQMNASPPLTVAARTQSFVGVVMEIDRFVVEVPPGNHTIVRDLEDSTVFPNEKQGDILCGIPNRLIVPRGTREGVKMAMAAYVTDYVEVEDESDSLSEEEEYWEKSALCGGRALDDGRPLGHPFLGIGEFAEPTFQQKQIYYTEFNIGTVDDSSEEDR